MCAGLALLLVGVGTAHADGYSLHVLATAQASWTDNIFSVPASGAALERESDIYYQFRPGAMLTYETPRTVHQVSYEIDASLYQEHDEAQGLQHIAGWRGFFLTSPRSELGLSAQFSTGSLTSLSTSTPASQPMQPQASGGSDYVSIDVGENLSFTPSQELRLTQGLRGRSFSTTDATDTATTGIEVGASGGADRGWKYSAVALQLGTSFVRLERATETPPVTDQLNLNAVVSWRRDFGPRWTGLFDGGVTSIVPLGDGEVVVQPTVGAQAAYAPNWGSAGLSIRRAVAPNLYLARNTVTDSAVVNAWLPLPWLTDDPLLPKLTIQLTAGAQRTQLIDTSDGAILSGFDLLTGDIAVGYTPRPGVTFGVRAQHLRQLADDSAVMELLSYDRTTVMVTVTGRWPDRLAAEIPARSSLRVDRSDNTPVGEEVPAQPAQ